ncbi:hypothetical protein, partial [Shigella sonnei]
KSEAEDCVATRRAGQIRFANLGESDAGCGAVQAFFISGFNFEEIVKTGIKKVVRGQKIQFRRNC